MGFIFPVMNSDQIVSIFPELTRAQCGLASSLELDRSVKHHMQTAQAKYAKSLLQREGQKATPVT